MALSVSSATVGTTGLTVAIVIAGGTNPILPATGVHGFTMTVDGVARSISSGTTSTATITLVPAEAIRVGQTVVVNYVAASGNVTDSAGSPLTLGNVTNQAVTNNSTADYPDDVEGLAGSVQVANVLTWDEVDDADTYNVYRNGVILSSTDEATFTDIVSDGKVYTYSVTAVTSSALESQARDMSVRAGVSLEVEYFNKNGDQVNPYGTLS